MADQELAHLHEEYALDPLVRGYIGEKYEVYTAYLLHGWKEDLGYSAEELEFEIQELQHLIVDAPKVNTARTLYRGVKTDFLAGRDQMLFNNFTSTSSLLSVARSFAGTTGVVLELHVPANYPMLYTGSSLNSEEEEYILPCGVKTHVTDTQSIDNITTYILQITN